MEGKERRTAPPPPPRGVTLRHPPQSTTSAASCVSAPAGPVAHRRATVKIHRLSKEILPAEGPADRVTYLETRYAYSVNGILGSAAQASAAAAFFAR